MNAAHWHLAINHIPVVGAVFAACLLAVALWRKSDESIRTSLGAMVVVAVLTIPVYLPGEPAEDDLSALAGNRRVAIQLGMIRPILILLGLAIAVTGCATTDETNAHFLQSYGVAKPAYEKMSHHKPLSLDDIAALAQVGVSGRFIVDYLRTTHAVYKVNDDDVLRLWQLGLSGRVIRYLSGASDAHG